MMLNNITSKEQAMSMVWVVYATMMASLVLGTGALVILEVAIKAVASHVHFYFEIMAFGLAILSLRLRRTLLGEFRHGDWTLESPEGARRFVMGNVVCFALSTSVGIMGVVVRSLDHAPDLYLVGAFALLLWHMPLAFRFRRRT